MNRNEIIEATKEFLSAEFEVDRDKIIPENNLKETLDLDSLDYEVTWILWYFQIK